MWKTDMTARKRFKRLVRARMAKTGESYMTALRYFRDRPEETAAMSDTELRTVVKADLGLTLGIPETWKEVPPNLLNSLNEVARFVEDSVPWSTTCLVFWNPKPDDRTTRQVAEGSKKAHQAQFQNFAFQEITFAGRKATRLEFDRKVLDQPRGSLWSAWELFVNVLGDRFCFGLGTLDIEGDRALFEQMAASVELHDPAVIGSLSEIALCRYSEAARRVVARSGRIAHELGEHTLHPRHLIYSLAEEGRQLPGNWTGPRVRSPLSSVPVILNALGVTQDKLSIPELSEHGADWKPDIWVGEELYELLTRGVQEMADASVQPLDILSAMLSSMPESVSALGK